MVENLKCTYVAIPSSSLTLCTDKGFLSVLDSSPIPHSYSALPLALSLDAPLVTFPDFPPPRID
jgi:hypothetical protein